jgi:lysophospholipase L1-like esterase
LELNKDGKTVRIAFVGASTTIGGYNLPYSYPELVGHWLNRWLRAQGWDVRVEIINAARSGIDTDSIAAIVRQEVLPVEPDLVVYYDGANEFGPRLTLKIPPRWMNERPRFTFRPPSRLEQFSALARRLTSFSVRFAASRWSGACQGDVPNGVAGKRG